MQHASAPTASPPGPDALALLRAENIRLQAELAARAAEARVTGQQMARMLSWLAGLYDLVPGILLLTDAAGSITRANSQAQRLLAGESHDLHATPLASLLPRADELLASFAAGRRDAPLHEEALFTGSDGSELPVLLSACGQYDDAGALQSLLLVGLDLRERRRLELELRHAQKLESLGQLAAGVAHEINTPMQFIGDNLHFIAQGITDLLGVLDGDLDPSQVDLGFLRARLPRAVERAHEGVSRVSGIVGAMRMFAHPGATPEPVDLNAVVGSAVSVCNHAFKYVADLELALGEVPSVPGVRGDLGQVMLNLITNAAHAIESRLSGDGGRGRLRIATCESAQRDAVEIHVEDDGCGIPDAIAHRVFDPFFTTKPVGRGTGQGLALARSIVVDRHGGELDFERVLPHGTRFVVRLPRDGRPHGVTA